MSGRSNVEIVQEGYAAFGRADVPAILALMDENVTWQIPNTPGIPWAGTFKGHEGLQKYFAILAQELEIEKFEPREFLSEGDTVVALGYARARTKGTGQPYETHWAHRFKLSNGRAIEVREYLDTATVAAAFTASGKVTA